MYLSRGLALPIILNVIVREDSCQAVHHRILIRIFAEHSVRSQGSKAYYQNIPIQIYRKFYQKKPENFQIKKD